MITPEFKAYFRSSAESFRRKISLDRLKEMDTAERHAFLNDPDTLEVLKTFISQIVDVLNDTMLKEKKIACIINPKIFSYSYKLILKEISFIGDVSPEGRAKAMSLFCATNEFIKEMHEYAQKLFFMHPDDFLPSVQKLSIVLPEFLRCIILMQKSSLRVCGSNVSEVKLDKRSREASNEAGSSAKRAKRMCDLSYEEACAIEGVLMLGTTTKQASKKP